jgi:hypothetical protein
MENNSLAIATITWARDEAEENLLRSSLTILAETGLPVFITDGGSNAGFLEFLAGFPQFHIYKANAKGVWAQVKNSLEKAYASGASLIFYTEPDKHDFFRQSLPSFLASMKTNRSIGIITASRSTTAFASFPDFQQMTETTINNCCAAVTRQKEDYTYGPFLMNRSLVPYLDLVKDDIGWGWRPYVFCVAHRLSETIQTVTGDFFCPPDQREDNHAERLYRMKQLQQNVQGIVLASTVNLNG